MVFSKRCKNLIGLRNLELEFNETIRNRIYKLMEKFNLSLERVTESNYNYVIYCFDELVENIKYTYGIIENNIDIKNIIHDSSTYYLFDIVELFYNVLKEKNEENNFEKRFNEIMKEEKLPWIMSEGEIIQISSIYHQEVILKPLISLLNKSKFKGAEEELIESLKFLTGGEYKEAINNAWKATESIIKCITKTPEAKPGELIEKISKMDFIPIELQKSIDDFISGVSCLRSFSGSVHGQGEKNIDIPQNFAELVVNVNASLMLYLMKSYNDKEENEKKRFLFNC
ncbi:MAG: hypothetical protein ABIN05_04925 [candidate division WOR-3 bacterium]